MYILIKLSMLDMHSLRVELEELVKTLNVSVNFSRGYGNAYLLTTYRCPNHSAAKKFTSWLIDKHVVFASAPDPDQIDKVKL